MLGTADGSCSWRCEKNDGRDVAPFEMSFALITQNYLGGADPKSPLVSPAYADYPRLITTGTSDLILSNGVRLYWKLREAGWQIGRRKLCPRLCPNGCLPCTNTVTYGETRRETSRGSSR
jgi:acetyl esterase/lipase